MLKDSSLQSRVEIIRNCKTVGTDDVAHGSYVVVVWSLSCPTLFATLVDYSLPGSFVHEISQARILE